MRQNRRPKVYYATQVAVNPPTIVLITNGPELFDPTYRRYLLKMFRDHLPFTEVPIKLYLRHKHREDEDGAKERLPMWKSLFSRQTAPPLLTEPHSSAIANQRFETAAECSGAISLHRKCPLPPHCHLPSTGRPSLKLQRLAVQTGGVAADRFPQTR